MDEPLCGGIRRTLNAVRTILTPKMGFRRASQERVNVFPVEERYLFKHYFDNDEIFDKLRRYYNNQQYRFEVPDEDFEEIQEFLAEFGYGLVVVDTVAEFAVAVQKYTEHPENIFKDSVLQRSEGDYNVFVMTDQAAVEQAELQGATRLTETEVEAGL